MKEEAIKYYGWYSIKQKKVCGSIKYKTPDNKIVEITCATDSETDHKTNWDDICLVGEITDFVGRVSGGEIGITFDNLDKDCSTPEGTHKILMKLLDLIKKVDQIQSEAENLHRWN